ncbi:MAG: FAD-dependent oxidoreductase [Candidatus Cloacimonetes bacterium]|nr:FAD-dependent oxidoreductase [Candidatus Cloacimonadota bacterium]
MREKYDVIILGSGIAGLTAAIYLKEAGFNILVVTKEEEIAETNTNYAQGGIIARGKDDSSNKLYDDILKAGCGYNNLKAVKLMTEQGPGLVFDFFIDKLGIEFSKTSEGDLDYTEEAAHSHRRVLHYNDQTGEKIESRLIGYCRELGMNILSSHTAIDLITNNHHSDNIQEYYQPREVMGVYVLNNNSGVVNTLFSHNVILATGGLGELYQHTTNPPAATGDGMSMAYRAGADIINAEFIQFHPTSFYHRDIKRFLISESLRGEGGRLFNPQGERFMERYEPKKMELAPRDVVARAIFEEMGRTGSEYMLLDIASFYHGKIPLDVRFPKIYETCLQGSIDITKEPIPIVPAAHYFCGGVRVDTAGRSSIKNLYAIGEVSCTGVHGANRLASSSLLEGLLWAKLSAEDIIDNFAEIDRKRFDFVPDWKQPPIEDFDPLLIIQDLKAIQMTMWNYAGIMRTEKGLVRAKADMNYYYHRIMKFYQKARMNRAILELRNAAINGFIIVKAASRNQNSIGCHHIRM